MWVESPDEISSKFWRSLLHPPPPPPGEWHWFVWNRTASISIFFFLSTFFLFFLSSFLSISHPHHQHLYTDIPSGKSSLPSAALEHTLFHAWSWHAHPWCDLTWSLQRHHLFSQQFPHFTICIPPLYESKAPWALACLPAVSQGHDYCTWSSSGTDELQRHGERVEDGVGKAWALETGWDSRKIENTWDYSPCAVLLSLRLFSLTCWIKLFCKCLHNHQVSAPVLLFSLLSFCLHKDPCFSNSHILPFLSFLEYLWSHWVWKKYCGDSKSTKVREVKDQGVAAGRDMLDPTGWLLSPSFSVQLGLPMLRVRTISETHWEWRWNCITLTNRNEWQKSGNLIKVIPVFPLHFVTDGNCFWS